MAELIRDAYSTAVDYMGAMPSWLGKLEARRISAYNFYDDLVDNNPTAYKLLLRGDESNPIYIPGAKKIVRTLARYVAKDLGFAVESPSDAESAVAITAYGDLFKRERFFSMFAAAKRQSLTRGDMCIYIMADMLKPEGSRLSIRNLDPRTYFPIEDPEDPHRILGADIIEQYTIGTTVYIRRQRYLRSIHPKHTAYSDTAPNYEAPVEYESVILEMDNWNTPESKTFRVDDPQHALEVGITSIPIYHFKVNEEGDLPFGRSVLQGLERILLGINQAITDEDVALAMAGLGLFRSSATPVDAEGNETDWVIGPKRVVQADDFERVSGLANVEPSQTHISYLNDQANQVTGVNDVALGVVDTGVAESGIALALRMGPLIDESNELDLMYKEMLTQFFFDLKFWFTAYEGINIPETTVVTPSFGQKLPRNKEGEFKQLYDLYANGVITIEYFHKKLREDFDMDIPANEAQLLSDKAAADAAAADPYAAQLAEEAAAGAQGTSDNASGAASGA